MKNKKRLLYIGTILVIISLATYLVIIKPNQIKKEIIRYAKETHQQRVQVDHLERKLFKKEWSARVSFLHFPTVDYVITSDTENKLTDTYSQVHLTELIDLAVEEIYINEKKSTLDSALIEKNVIESKLFLTLANNTETNQQQLKKYEDFIHLLTNQTGNLTFLATISNEVKTYHITNFSEKDNTELLANLSSVTPYLVDLNTVHLKDDLKHILKKQGYTKPKITYLDSSVPGKHFARLSLTFDNFKKENSDYQEGFQPENLLAEKDGTTYYRLTKQEDASYSLEQGDQLLDALQKVNLSVYQVEIIFTTGSYGHQEETKIYQPLLMTEPLSENREGVIAESQLTANTTNPYEHDPYISYQEKMTDIQLPNIFNWVTDSNKLPMILGHYTRERYGTVLSYTGDLDDLAQHVPELNKQLQKEHLLSYGIILIEGTTAAYYFDITNYQPNYQLIKIDQGQVGHLLVESAITH